MKYFFLLFFTLSLTLDSYSQDTVTATDNIFCKALDSIVRHIKNQGPNVYHDWVNLEHMKDSPLNHFETISSNYFLNVLVDTVSNYMRLTKYTSKKIFEYFLRHPLADSNPKFTIEKPFSKSIKCLQKIHLASGVNFDDSNRFIVDSAYYETVIIKCSQLYSFKNHAFLYFSLLRGKNDHGLSFIFFYNKKHGKWVLQNKKFKESIDEWMQH